MSKTPQRSVLFAKIDNVGIVSAEELIAMPPDKWGSLRDEITRQRQGGDGFKARCCMCGHGVYIRKDPRTKLPLFEHYRDAPKSCVWHSSFSKSMAKARAAKYKGLQESNFHEMMCHQVAELAALDERYKDHTVNDYLRADHNKHGRYPDVFVEWEGFGKFVVEFQLSASFQPEIIGRGDHYRREEIPLLWILFGLDVKQSLQQFEIDIIRQHRNNAFLLDQEAIEASREQETLVLKCLPYIDQRLGNAELVRFDELSVSATSLVYHDDHLIAPILRKAKERREAFTPSLKQVKDRINLEGLDRQASVFIAAVFSILTHHAGKKINYVSYENNLKAMLNTFLHNGELGPYVDFLSAFIAQTNQSRLLVETKHLKTYRADHQIGAGSEEVKMLSELIPEIFDPITVQMLKTHDEVPKWACKIDMRAHTAVSE